MKLNFYPSALNAIARILNRGCNLQTPKKKNYENLRGQAIDYIGAQFGQCKPLESRDKSLKMLKICRHDQSKHTRRRKDQREQAFWRSPYTIHTINSLASQREN